MIGIRTDVAMGSRGSDRGRDKGNPTQPNLT